MTRLALAILIAALASTVASRAQAPSPEEAQPPAAAEPAPQPVPASPVETLPRPPAAIPPPPAAVAPQAPVPQASVPTEEGRYAFHRVQDSFVRLDTHTGQVSLCGHGPNGWTCKTVPDERTALESEIERLQGDNAALKKELLAHNLDLPSGVRPDPVSAAPRKDAPAVHAPSDADLDRVMGFVEKVWRRMVEMMMSVQREMQRKS